MCHLLTGETVSRTDTCTCSIAAYFVIFNPLKEVHAFIQAMKSKYVVNFALRHNRVSYDSTAERLNPCAAKAKDIVCAI